MAWAAAPGPLVANAWAAQCDGPSPTPASCGVVVFDGDSISFGTGAPPGRRLEDQFAQDLDRPARFHNVASPGRPVYECLERFPTAVAPLLAPAARFKLIVFHAGDNDIARNKSAPGTYRAFSEYVAAAHAQGWRIIVSTELQRVDWGPAKQAELAAYNKRLIANAAGADAVVDLDADPSFADPAKRTDPNLFSGDRIHPSAGGYAVIARMLSSAARPLLPR